MPSKFVYQVEGYIKGQQTPKVLVELKWSEKLENLMDSFPIPFYDKTSGIGCSYPIETRRQRNVVNELLQHSIDWDEAESWVLHERVESR